MGFALYPQDSAPRAIYVRCWTCGGAKADPHARWCALCLGYRVEIAESALVSGQWEARVLEGEGLRYVSAGHGRIEHALQAAHRWIEQETKREEG